MPGTVTFKPLAASLNLGKKADPYCTFTMGDQRAQGKPSGMGGKNPHWDDSVTLNVVDQPKCVVELKDQNNKSAKGFIGNFEIDLHEVESNGKLRKWFTVFNQNKTAGEILVEASYAMDHTNNNNLGQPEESEIAAQGNVPEFLDMGKTSQTAFKISREPQNSLAKAAETNEFGDYNPEKQLFGGDVRHETGSGMIQQGQYYSGAQTSYGEAYPMAHKSVALDHIQSIEEYGQTVVPRGSNPTDYARFVNQAFVPHHTEISDVNNSSVVEKALHHAKMDDLYKKGAITPSIRLGNQLTDYRANEGASYNFYATEKALDDKERDFGKENTPTSGRTFGSNTQASSRKESMSDIIAREKDISKGVGQPTPHGVSGDPDSFHNDFRDIKNTQQRF